MKTFAALNSALNSALSLALALTTVLAGCGGDDGTTDGSADAPDADGGLADAPDSGEATRPTVFAVAGDFMAGAPGASATVELQGLTATQHVAPTGAVSSDPIVRLIENKLYVVNRFGANNVTVLTPNAFAGAPQQFATGAGSNPQDVAVVGAKLYVPTLAGKGLTVVGAGITAHEIDLSALDSDGVPNCVSAYKVGTYIYVACALLDENFMPRGNAKVAIIDSATDTVKSALTVTLTTANPISLFEQLPDGNLVISTVPSFTDTTTGGVELVTTGATPTAAGRIIINTALGGYASALAVSKAGSPILWMAVSAYPAGSLRGYDLTSRELWPAAVSPTTQTIGDVTTCADGEVAVSDTTMANNGIRIYASDLTERTTAALAIGLPPTSTHGLACY